jgi:hypothetical protein
MRHPVRTLRRLLLVICGFVLLLPGVAAATPSLAVELDGDDRHDRVAVDSHDPSVLRIWLSASNTIQLIRTEATLQRVIAADLDGDHRLELVAHDSRSRIRVWTRTHQEFREFRARHSVGGLLWTANQQRVDEPDALAPCALMPCAQATGPALATFHTQAPRMGGACRLLPAIDPFAPRPPPAHISL